MPNKTWLQLGDKLQNFVHFVFFPRFHLPIAISVFSLTGHCGYMDFRFTTLRAIFKWVSKVIRNSFVFCITSLCAWSTKLASLSKPIGWKLKSITIWTPAFSRTLGNLVEFTISSHWLLKIFSFLLIGLCVNFRFSFTALNREAFS